MKRSGAIAVSAAWIEQFVIGHGLCPFAAVPWSEGKVRLVAVNGATEEILKQALEEAFRLRHTDPERLETTLLVVAQGLDDFVDYLDVSGMLEDLLEEGGFAGEIQLATFHPAYRFEGAERDDPANYTNRSPYPMWHLIREASVSKAVASHPDPEGIPARNVALLRQMNPEALKKGIEKRRHED